jgi:hypothetical protein
MISSSLTRPPGGSRPATVRKNASSLDDIGKPSAARRIARQLSHDAPANIGPNNLGSDIAVTRSGKAEVRLMARPLQKHRPMWPATSEVLGHDRCPGSSLTAFASAGGLPPVLKRLRGGFLRPGRLWLQAERAL